jgi:lysyl-tRNA synthetase, class I
VPPGELPVSFSLLLNLVGVLGVNANREQVLNYLGKYFGESLEEAAARDKMVADRGMQYHEDELARLVDYAIAYHRDLVASALKRRSPTKMEAEALRDLDSELARLPADASAEDIQTQVFEVGKRHPFENLRAWFQALYETLLGSSQGPRMGSFIALYGIDNSRKLIAEALGA